MSDRHFASCMRPTFSSTCRCMVCAEVPDAISRWMIDAPYLAAERVFDTAIQEHVKLVVLDGQPVGSDARRTRGRSVSCGTVWAIGGALDFDLLGGESAGRAADWPASLSLPASVHHFSAAAVDTVALENALKFPLTVVGRSGDEQW